MVERSGAVGTHGRRGTSESVARRNSEADITAMRGDTNYVAPAVFGPSGGVNLSQSGCGAERLDPSLRPHPDRTGNEYSSSAPKSRAGVHLHYNYSTPVVRRQ